ncbi:sodium:proline symporter [Endozoicomonas sp. OPT23]|uniref:sodium/proline symporter n=1 Tax=Endozoicomonas sp. OPT23 TaxID=2072845 RepID=UPI00129B1A62|nr:sodium/proline symporter [Endozoicomonas sp. OPT23]MRI33568.1 sodium:proline symporter [Endozoicomonas sp. OPT23]
MSGYLAISLYFVLLGWLGYRASRKTEGVADFFTGGRQLGYFVTALSTQATGESAWLLLGLTGLGAIAGLSAFWVVVGELIGVSIAWFVMAEPFRREIDQSRALTTTDYFLHRFPSLHKMIRYTSVVCLTIFCTLYAAAEIDATGALLEHSLNWNYAVGAIVGFLVVTLYSSAGGFLAVAWTDCIQGSMMLVALLLVPVAAAFFWPWEQGLFTVLADIDPALLTVIGPDEGWLRYFEILGLFTIGLGFLGTPHIFSRFIAIRDSGEIRCGRWVALIYTLLTDSAAVFIGMIGRCFYTSADVNPETVLGNGGQNVLTMLTQSFFPQVVVGFYVAAILAAIMSTFSSLLMQATSAVTCDALLYGQESLLTSNKNTTYSRKITWGLATVALLLALAVAKLLPGHTVFWFAVFGMSGITATFSPAMILGLFWSGYSSVGALVSMITGATMILVGKLWLQQLDAVGPYFQAMESLPLAFLLSMMAGWGASLLWPDIKRNSSPERKKTLFVTHR